MIPIIPNRRQAVSLVAKSFAGKTFVLLRINKSFLNHHISYQKEVVQNNLTLLESAICFIKKLDFPELILFGVTSSSELESFYSSITILINCL